MAAAFPQKITCVFTQLTPAATWHITHGLHKKPSVTIVDSAGSVVTGDVLYVDTTSVTVTFSSAFAGEAYLN